jgi:osmotically-inducible protein OsmY
MVLIESKIHRFRRGLLLAVASVPLVAMAQSPTTPLQPPVLPSTVPGTATQQQGQPQTSPSSTPAPTAPESAAATSSAPRPAQTTGAPYDIELSARVREALFNDRTLSVDAKNNIQVSTSAGVATVRGTVRNSTEVERVISVVRRVTGRDAVNGLTTSMRTTE